MINFSELPSDGIRFEQLARELLVRSGFEVHWTGVGPDGGRDLLVIETAEGTIAPFRRRWLVSCKHHCDPKKSVGMPEVSNINDACEAVSAGGFLLICSTQPTAAVVKRFEEIETSGKRIMRYWDGVEIETRLNTPQAFPLVHLFFPESARTNPWRLYNTYSPSFWAANYRDYFFYLSSRTAHTSPSLQDVEEIVRRIESIELPRLGRLEQHRLRLRAVYFDNKHENFSVFVDYMYPRDKRVGVLSPHALNHTLHDGRGLYAEEGVEWYTTYWDVRYVPCSPESEHFHLDHKDYYEPYIERFRIGFPRGSFLSDMISSLGESGDR